MHKLKSFEIKAIFSSAVQKFLRSKSFYRVAEVKLSLETVGITGKGAIIDLGRALLGLLITVSTLDTKLIFLGGCETDCWK